MYVTKSGLRDFVVSPVSRYLWKMFEGLKVRRSEVGRLEGGVMSVCGSQK